MTDPPGPGQVAAAVDPGRLEAQGLLDGGHPALAHPHGGGPGVGRQAVDVVQGEPGVLDRGEAGVHGQRQRVPHQAPADGRAADPRQHGPVLEAVGRHGGPRRRPLRLGDGVGGIVPAGRLEEGEPHVLAGLEADLDLLADVDLVGLAADDVGGQVHGRVLGQHHVGDHVRRLEVRVPRVVVDGEADHGPGAGHLGRRPGAAAADRADRRRWVDHRPAVVALLDAEATVGAGGPEPLVGRGQLGEGTHGRSRGRWDIEGWSVRGLTAPSARRRGRSGRRRVAPWRRR